MSTFSAKLRDLVSIRQNAGGRDAAGQPSDDWSEIREDWSDIRTTGGLEAIRAGAVTGKVNASIRMRYCTDITAAMQVWHEGKKYQILAVLPDANKVYVDLLCEVVS